MLSALLARCRCRGIGAPKISLVNEVQCGTGTEWRDLIGQQLGKLLCKLMQLDSAGKHSSHGEDRFHMGLQRLTVALPLVLPSFLQVILLREVEFQFILQIFGDPIPIVLVLKLLRLAKARLLVFVALVSQQHYVIVKQREGNHER